jgi:hypothetical protein
MGSRNASRDQVELSREQLITAADEINNTSRVTVIDSTSGVYAITITSGLFDGQEKFVIHKAGTNAVTLSGAFFMATSAISDVQGEAYHMVWNESDANWYVVGATAGVTV